MTPSGLKKSQRIALHSASFLFGLLLVGWMPLFYLYGRIVCLMAWLIWISPTSDVILVFNGRAEPDGTLTRLLQMLQTRAVILDYEDRERWRFSIPTQLFRCFGPQPVTDFYMPGFLPTVIVMRRFRKPASFSFGKRFGDQEATLVRLQAELEHSL
ncbi:MAG TPA: hypothetical protein VNB54_12120 [Alphaproteobacteria bacterium]|nr:hypothetical protein [Alphaproteobacteria bacterium]